MSDMCCLFFRTPYKRFQAPSPDFCPHGQYYKVRMYPIPPAHFPIRFAKIVPYGFINVISKF